MAANPRRGCRLTRDRATLIDDINRFFRGFKDLVSANFSWDRSYGLLSLRTEPMGAGTVVLFGDLEYGDFVDLGHCFLVFI